MYRADNVPGIHHYPAAQIGAAGKAPPVNGPDYMAGYTQGYAAGSTYRLQGGHSYGRDPLLNLLWQLNKGGFAQTFIDGFAAGFHDGLSGAPNQSGPHVIPSNPVQHMQRHAGGQGMQTVVTHDPDSESYVTEALTEIVDAWDSVFGGKTAGGPIDSSSSLWDYTIQVPEFLESTDRSRDTTSHLTISNVDVPTVDAKLYADYGKERAYISRRLQDDPLISTIVLDTLFGGKPGDKVAGGPARQGPFAPAAGQQEHQDFQAGYTQGYSAGLNETGRYLASGGTRQDAAAFYANVAQVRDSNVQQMKTAGFSQAFINGWITGFNAGWGTLNHHSQRPAPRPRR